MNSKAPEPTAASTWQAASGIPITDEILEWPADLFALTDVILDRSEAYRFVLSPPGEVDWPPARFSNWSDAVQEAAFQWTVWIDDRQGAMPGLLTAEWEVFRGRAQTPIEDLAEGREPRMCEALLTLHAIADEACAGLGVALDRSNGKGCACRARGRELLARTGSMARIKPSFLRVLPKLRTPLSGTSLRNFSRYACVRGSAVEARWHKVPCRRAGTDSRSRHANLLLLPWPLRVRESDFRPVESSVQRLAKEPYGFFEFAPSERLDLDLVERVIAAACDEVDSVDFVMMPESAVDERDLSSLEALLDRLGVTVLLTGVRQHSAQPGRYPGNWVHIGVNPMLEKGVLLPRASGEEWIHIRQNKHHRWSLDEGQILQYHLGGALYPQIRWWEAMDIPRRTAHFVELGDEITMVSLVCEDLAQIDDVAEVIRSVGPTVVLTPLLDGPQLNSRWSSRYASVLADDPGSAVLTLTSYGMTQRSRPQGRDASAVVAMWKDPIRGMREISLEAGAHGILLTACGGRGTRRSVDGRSPVDNTTRQFDGATYQVRAKAVGSISSKPQTEMPVPRTLEVEELTILVGWAEAVTEAVAYNPDCFDSLLANARAGAPWRAEFHIPEPSQKLSEAINLIGRLVRRAPLTLEGLIATSGEDQPGEEGLERLARRVLRSTLEQLRTRQTLDLL